MAKGTGGVCVRCYLAFAAVIVIVLAATGAWNPFPGLLAWINRTRPIATGQVSWQQRLDNTPQRAAIVGGAVIVDERTEVEARGLVTGGQLWHRNADWSAVVGDAKAGGVVVGKLLKKGYDVLDPLSGLVRRHDGRAKAVWTYRDQLLDVRCDGPSDCTLTAWPVTGSDPLWRAHLPGVDVGIFANNPDLRGTRLLSVSEIAATAGGAPERPQLLAFPTEGGVVLVDTARGSVLRRIRQGDDGVFAIGGRAVRVAAVDRDGTCYFTVTGSDPATDTTVWRTAGLNLRTADGSGCTQRDDPAGARNVVLGVGPDGQDLLIDAYDGRTLWRATDGARVQALDDRYALVRAADNKALSAYALGGARLWHRPVRRRAQAALTPYAAIVFDRDPDRMTALLPGTGAVLAELRTSARVIAVGPAGMVVNDGRQLAYAPFAGGGG